MLAQGWEILTYAGLNETGTSLEEKCTIFASTGPDSPITTRNASAPDRGPPENLGGET
jgi:hypothetical protein